MRAAARLETSMHQNAYRIVLVSAVALLACTETATDPPVAGPGPEQITLPQLIVSEATAPSTGTAAIASSASGTTYVSLPPGTLTDVVIARIRNKTSAGAATAVVPVIDGGFDPVAVLAGEGDELELEFTHTNGAVSVAYVKVPARRPPRIVRTAPPAGRTDVALSIRPEVILSEPIDPRTVTPASVRLLSDGADVDGNVQLIPGEPWVAVFAPTSPLEPGTAYQLVVTRDVRDVQGDALEAPFTFSFTTTHVSAPLLAGKIAFVSTRDGAPHIYVASANGSGVARLTSGEAPAWSPDGRRIAFHRAAVSVSSPGSLHVMDADGSNERWLAEGTRPAWSPDGTKIAFAGTAGLSVMEADGSAVTTLIHHDFRDDTFRPWDLGVGKSAWSSDGKHITFEHLGDTGVHNGFLGVASSQVYLINADGSELRRLRAYSITSAESNPVWLPNASSIAFWSSIFGIVIASADGSLVRSIIHERFLVSGDVGLAWSPDGQWLAFNIQEWSWDWSSEKRSIHFAHRDGGWVRELIADGYDAAWALSH